jgi:hypothetical protein
MGSSVGVEAGPWPGQFTEQPRVDEQPEVAVDGAQAHPWRSAGDQAVDFLGSGVRLDAPDDLEHRVARSGQPEPPVPQRDLGTLDARWAGTVRRLSNSPFRSDSHFEQPSPGGITLRGLAVRVKKRCDAITEQRSTRARHACGGPVRWLRFAPPSILADTTAERQYKTDSPQAQTAREALETERQAARLGLAKTGAEIGRIGAETAESRARVGEIGAASRKVEQEIAERRQPKPTEVAGMREEFTAPLQPFVQVRDAFQGMQVAAPGDPGDIARIYAYMKILDPGCVVREGEYATAQNAAGFEHASESVPTATPAPALPAGSTAPAP